MNVTSALPTSNKFPEVVGLGTLMRHATDLLDGGVERAYAMQGIDCRSRFTPVLRHIQRTGPTSIKVIAQANGVSHSAISQTASELLKRGLIVSKPGKDDSRERILSLAPKGRALLAKLSPIWEAIGEADVALMASTSASSLREALLLVIEELERQPFEERILERLRAAPQKRSK